MNLPQAPLKIDLAMAASVMQNVINGLQDMGGCNFTSSWTNAELVQVLGSIRDGATQLPRRNDVLPVPRIQIHERTRAPGGFSRGTKERSLYVASIVGVNGKCVQETDDYQDLSAVCKRANDFAAATGWPIVWTIETTQTQTYTAIKQAPEVPFAPSLATPEPPHPATARQRKEPKHEQRVDTPRMINQFKAGGDDVCSIEFSPLMRNQHD